MTVLADPAPPVGLADDRGYRTAQRRKMAVAYLFPVVVTVGTTFVWFAPHGFIAGVDEAPYVRTNLGGELWSLWNHQTTGAGSVSYSSAQALDVILLRATHLIGLSSVSAQHLLFAICFGLAAFGAAFLTGVWVRRPIVVAATGLVGVFNTYLLVNQPNVLPALAIGLVGTFAGAMLRAARADARVTRAKLIMVLLATLGFSYLALNPPLLVMSLLALLAAALGATPLVGGRATPRALRHLATVGVAAMAINLWWIVPAVVTICGHAGTTFAAQTHVGAWSWTQARTSLAGVATLNGHWGWTQPEYFPYSHAMDSGIWPALGWILPLLALLGAVVVDRARRAVAWSFAGTALVLLFFAKGVHPPFRSVNLWLFDHVPGMWLFRDPMSKFGVLLVLVYAILVAIALDRMPALLRRVIGPRAVRIGVCCLSLVYLGALAFPWPLWTGAVFPSTRASLPGVHVTIPAAWYRAAASLNAETQGKVLVLPLDPYYQVSTTWGYHGIDQVPAQLIKAPVLQELPGTYFSGTPGIDALLDGVQTALLAKQPTAVLSELRALGVSDIVVRHDLRTAPDLPAFADARAIDAGLEAVPGMGVVRRFGVANVYRLEEPATPGRVLPSLIKVQGDAATIAAAIGSTSTTEAATANSVAPVTGATLPIFGTPGRETIDLAETGSYDVTPTPGARLYRPQVESTPAGAVLALTDALRVDIDGVPLPSSPDITVPVSGEPVAIGADGIVAPIGSTPIEIGAATPLSIYGVDDASSVVVGALTAGCAGAATTTCAQAAVQVPAGKSVVSIGFQYRASVNVRICVWEGSLSKCAPVRAITSGADWRSYTGIATLDKNATDLHLYLYADDGVHAPAPAVSPEYQGISVAALRPVGSAVLHVSQPGESVARMLAAGSHVVNVQLPDSKSQSRSFLAVQECGRHEVVSATVELRAASGSSCAWAVAASGQLADAYAVDVEYRTVSGRPARVCVWEVGPNRCAPIPALDDGPGWHRLDAAVRPDSGTRELDVYLYADGQQSPRTVTEYRRVTVSPRADVTLNIRDIDPPAAAPIATWHVEDSTHYDVALEGAHGAFVVTVPESYAPGWKLSGLPSGWSARHVEVDGYANGWLVSGHGSATLTVSYTPQRWVRLVDFGCMTLLAMIGALALFETARAVARRRADRKTSREGLPRA